MIINTKDLKYSMCPTCLAPQPCSVLTVAYMAKFKFEFGVRKQVYKKFLFLYLLCQSFILFNINQLILLIFSD